MFSIMLIELVHQCGINAIRITMSFSSDTDVDLIVQWQLSCHNEVTGICIVTIYLLSHVQWQLSCQRVTGFCIVTINVLSCVNHCE